MINYGSSLKEFVRKFRIENDMTQRSLAKYLGYPSPQVICDVEKGRRFNISLAYRLLKKIDKKRAEHLTFLIHEGVDKKFYGRKK